MVVHHLDRVADRDPARGGTTLALTPRRFRRLPASEFTKRIASRPKRWVNLAQPVCGAAVISTTAAPIRSRVPAGSSSVPRWEIDVELVAGERPIGL